MSAMPATAAAAAALADPCESNAERAPLAAAAPRPARTLRRRALEGSLWTVGGHGASEALRLLNHVVCFHLLGPAALGIMVVVNVVLQGLKMFSEIGVSQGVVQHPRGDEPGFLDTAFTLQALRGAFLFAVAALFAWPLALGRGENVYLALLPIAALTALLDGVRSTAPAMLHRRLELGRLTMYELSVRVVAVGATILLAWTFRSVFALALGAVVASAYGTVASHAMLGGHRQRFGWDREALGHLVRFGRWIFIGTVLAFLCAQGDKLVLSATLENEALGFYAAAFIIATAVPLFLKRITRRVLFPILARLAERADDHQRSRVAQARLWLYLATVPPLVGIAIAADPIAQLLYPDGDAESIAWILRILAAGNIPRVLAITVQTVLLARADSFRHMLTLVAESVILIGAMAAGGFLYGFPGLVSGVAVTPLLSYPVVAWAAKRHGMWMPLGDLVTLAAAGAALGVGVLVFP